MTKTPKNPQLPLAKSSRSAFEKRFEEIYLKAPESGISDEVLIKAVNDHDASNQGSQSGQEQKGIQDEENNPGTDEAGKIESGAGDQQDEFVKDQKGNLVDRDQELPMSEEEIKKSIEKYFDLFGVKPLESMTMQQVLNSIEVKQSELDKAEKPKVVAENPVELKEGQIYAINSVGEKVVINKGTLKFLPDFKEFVLVPKELKNK